ncbi:MAG TPA: PP2C family serine/threonine-protein phosphatase [Gemmatimonadaceae bacterium]|nr:PP2C family serine/threonine-protein phosphatase [Gemmatimonadaceae bacterium]
MNATTHEDIALQRPRLAEIDAFGLTHPGLVRKTNADQFLVASLHRTLHVHATSLNGGLGPEESETRGFLLLVADGVGGLAGAAEGSAKVVATVAQHLLHASELCSQMAATHENEAINTLLDAVAGAHRALLTAPDDEGATPASTLTMFASFWPRAFVVHVGDSRAYRYRDGALERLTTDQTFAQMMVQAGALTPAGAEASHLKHVLWSAIGSQEVVPDVLVTDVTRRGVILLCTDGLTNHVSDDEIKSQLASCKSAERTCHGLVDLALSRGGSDNVTVVIGRVRGSEETHG